MVKHGDGSVTRRKDGRYMVRVHNPITNKPVTRYARTTTAAEQLRRKMVKEIRHGDAEKGMAPSSRLTIGDLVDDMDRNYVQIGADRTAQTDAYRRRLVKQVFSRFPMDTAPADIESRLTRWALGDFRKDQPGVPYSPDTIGKMHRGLDEVFRYAVKARVIDAGAEPMRYVDRPKVGKRKRRLNPLSAMDADAVLDALAQALGGEDDELRSMAERQEVAVHLLLMGLRPQEVRAVQWSCVDLEDGLLVVDAAMTSVGGRQVLGPPKTERSMRRLALSANTIEALRRHHARQQTERNLGLWPADTTGFVVLSEVGTPLDRWQLARDVARWCKAAGVGHHSPYDFRSTAGSLASDGGLTDEQVSAMLGNRRQTARHHYIVNRAPIDLPDGLGDVFGGGSA